MTAPRVLVVEDNPLTRKMVRLTLESGGYEIAEAADGREALAAVAERPPDLLLQDLLLPDVDGLELIGRIRASHQGTRFPAIAVSGLAARLIEGEASNAGFDAYLLKPVEPSRLLAVVAAHIGTRTVAAEAPEGALVVVACGDDTRRELLALRLTGLGHQVVTAADALAALRLARAKAPRAIVADVLLPGRDGFMLSRAVRNDPALPGTSVVLISDRPPEPGALRLSDDVGAEAIVHSGDHGDELVDVLALALSHAPRPMPDVAPDQLRAEHAAVLARLVDDLIGRNAELERRTAGAEVEVAILSGMANVLARSDGLDGVYDEVLARCLEGAGLSAGALFIAEAGAAPVLRAHMGIEAGLTPHLDDLCGDAGPLDIVMLEREPLLVPSDRADEIGAAAPLAALGMQHALLCPLAQRDGALGVLMLGSPSAMVGEPQVAFARLVASEIANGLSLAGALMRLGSSREEMIERLARAAEFRDNETGRHTQRMSRYCELLAARVGLSPERCELIRVASLLHDIGKIGVPDAILLKPGPLTPGEYEEMKRHPEIGGRILAGSEAEAVVLAAEIAMTHQERIDGSGYPKGLVGDEIPLEGRIAAIADVFDALTSDRIYRRAFSVSEAVQIMSEQRGTKLDADLLDIFLGALDDVEAIRATYADKPEHAVFAAS